MSDNRPTDRANFPVLDFALFVLLFSYPLLSLLWRRSYPVFTQEVFQLFLGIVGLSLLLSLITSRVRPMVAHLVAGLAILFSAMLQFNLRIEGLAIGIAALAFAIYFLRHRFSSFCVTVLTALIIGAYFDSVREETIKAPEELAEGTNTELGPVIHILLDSFIGIGGLPDYPASDIIREKILDFSERNSFQLYTHAYSRYSLTGDAIYSTMNYRHDGDSIFTLENYGRLKHVMKTNTLFTELENLGYRLNIYQTGHLDLCQSNTEKLDRCWQYDHPNLGSLESSMNTQLKFRALFTVLLSQSRLISSFVSDHLLQPFSPELAVHDPKVFEELNRDLQTRARGNYFFAHALIPHAPFAYMPDCSVSYNMPREYRVSSQKNEVELPPLVYEVRNGLYFAQTECALNMVQGVIDVLKESGVYDRATIILHGDHGSHITRKFTMKKNANSYTKEDYRAAYSTLFAVKYPGSKFLVDQQVLPLAYLLEEFMKNTPAWSRQSDNYPGFDPSSKADPEKVAPYVYFQGTYPLHRVDVNIFED